MAYSQSKKLTAQEKKLLALRLQLYGKEQPEVSLKKTDKPSVFQFNAPEKSPVEDSYLKKDLHKIAILSTVIFGIQALLYLSINRGLINF